MLQNGALREAHWSDRWPILPWSLGREQGPVHTVTWDIPLQNHGTLYLCCLKPPGLWHFGEAAPGKNTRPWWPHGRLQWPVPRWKRPLLTGAQPHLLEEATRLPPHMGPWASDGIA